MDDTSRPNMFHLPIAAAGAAGVLKMLKASADSTPIVSFQGRKKLSSISRLSLIGLGLLGLATNTALADKNIYTETFNNPAASCKGLQLAGVTYSSGLEL